MPAKSKAQQKLFGIAHAVQQGKMPASKVSNPAKDIAKNVKKREVKKFASTDTTNLPDRVKKEIKEIVTELVKETLAINETPESKKWLSKQPKTPVDPQKAYQYYVAFRHKMSGAPPESYEVWKKRWDARHNEAKDPLQSKRDFDAKDAYEQYVYAQKTLGSKVEPFNVWVKGWKNNAKEAINHTMIDEGNKCSICGKPSKENTYGNPKYCQGHSQSELAKLRKQKQESAQPSQLAKLQEKLGRSLSVPEKHQLAIAYKTVKMPEAMVGVMGGMTIQQAKDIIQRLTGKEYKERKTEGVVNEETLTSQELEKLGIKAKYNGADEIVTKDGRHWGFVGNNKWVCTDMKKESVTEGITYVAIYNGKEIAINNATSLYDAKKKAIERFKPAKSKEHMISVMPAEKDGEPIKHVATEGFTKDEGVPVKEQYKFNPEYAWLKKMALKNKYQIGPVTVLLAFDPKKRVMGINAMMIVNPTHPAQDAPRHIEAALDSITGEKETIFKLDKIAPHKDKTTSASVQKLWLLPADKISTFGQKESVKEDYYNYSAPSYATHVSNNPSSPSNMRPNVPVKKSVKKIALKNENGDTWYLTYIDPTHFSASIDPKKEGHPYHIGQMDDHPHLSKQFVGKIRVWLQQQSKQGR
jgi:hypothetical protein